MILINEIRRTECARIIYTWNNRHTVVNVYFVPLHTCAVTHDLDSRAHAGGPIQLVGTMPSRYSKRDDIALQGGAQTRGACTTHPRAKSRARVVGACAFVGILTCVDWPAPRAVRFWCRSEVIKRLCWVYCMVTLNWVTSITNL